MEYIEPPSVPAPRPLLACKEWVGESSTDPW